MKIRVTNMLPLIVMVVLAALTLWLRQAAELPESETRSSGKGPEAVVDNLTLVRLNASGTTQYSLSASKMLVYPSDGATLLEMPRFERHDADGVSTLVTANRGRVSKDGEEAFFHGNVMLNRNAPGARTLQARTEYLQIVPAQDLARTDRHVTITDGTSTLSGTGMEISKLKKQISLQSQVKGTYHGAKRN
jgi:lipopolysaccharide export system protein LptC